MQLNFDIRVRLLAVAAGIATGLLVAPTSSARADGGAGGQGAAAAVICTAETPAEFVCRHEWNGMPAGSKWQYIDVDTTALTSGGTCDNYCTFSYTVTMTAKPGTYGTYPVLGDQGGNSVTFDSTTPSHTFSNSSLIVECGETHLFDVSYPPALCPAACPDGPGPCSIASATFSCGPLCP